MDSDIADSNSNVNASQTKPDINEPGGETETTASTIPIDINSDPALWPQIMQPKFIDVLVCKGPSHSNIGGCSFPLDEKKRHFSAHYLERVLDNGEKLKRRWLVYSQSADKVFCFCCKIFQATAVNVSSLAMAGSKDWKHLNDILKQLERSATHFSAYGKWMEAETRRKLNKGIDEEHQRIMRGEIQHWRSVLERLIAISVYLAEHNMAFRGSSDKLFTANNGNFLGLVQLLGKYDDVMHEHLRRVSSDECHDHYCGKTIQNELLNLLSSKVLENILNRLRDAKYYSIILDCTPDVSHAEKMSFTVRFVEEDEKKICIREHIIGFKTVSESTGEGLTEVLMNTLTENGIDIKNCRGQGYDNGANMKGRNKGVQARVLKENKRACFLPCSCHSLNLVVSDAASSSVESVSLFGILQRIYVLFSASVQRWKILTDHISNLTVKPLSGTRWESRIEAVKPVRYQTKEISDALLEIAQSRQADAGLRHEAQCLADQVTDFKFLISVTVWYDVLFQINIASKSMQGINMDIARATSLLKSCVQFLMSYRESGYAEAVIVAKEIAESLGSDVNFKERPRQRRKKRLFEYESSDNDNSTPEQRFMRDFFYALVDCAQSSIDERFKQLEEHAKIWTFLYNLHKLPRNEELDSHCANLEKSLTDGENTDINGADLSMELKHLRHIFPQEPVKGSPQDVLQYISTTDTRDIFPNVWVALRILLTLPVTVAAGERSFSKLKLIKTYLRSTMADERLTSLAILSIENSVAHSLDISDMVQQFARAKARKATF